MDPGKPVRKPASDGASSKRSSQGEAESLPSKADSPVTTEAAAATAAGPNPAASLTGDGFEHSQEGDWDSGLDDSDSALGSSIRDSTMSLTDSIYSAIEENGRLYHSFKDGKYVLPNDAREQDRLDLQNHLFGLTLEGKLHLAPISPNPQNVLDIGTGTGIWAIDFANQYPSASVIGTDLSVVQPLYVPPNLRFEICDAEDQWDYGERFDYVHGRMITVCFRNVRDVFRNVFDSLKPGGWLEMQDACFSEVSSDDGSFEGTAMQTWFGELITAGRKLGREFGTQPPHYAKYLEEIGFIDVKVEVRRWPFGPWPEEKKMKEIGLWSRANALDGLQAVSMAVLTRGLGRTAAEVERELVDVRKDYLNPAIHSYLPIYFVYGRKP